MSRLSFRPRPLDINKKLPILKSLKDIDDDDVPTSTRNSQLLRLASEPEAFEVQPTPSKRVASEIPTPQFVVVDTYERDYTRTFTQPASYLRGRGVRAEIGEFIEYDMDNEDEEWLQELNKERNILAAEKLEAIIFKLEVLDHKARERAGIVSLTLGSTVPVILSFDAAVEALQSLSIRYGVFQSIYNYWKEKRKRWQKPVLRRLQPPPPVNDTNPYNVFRPREKAHRLHTRRMQRRENNVQSFEKLRQVRRNLDQAKAVLDALIKREEKKRDLADNEVALQRIQMKYKVSIFPESKHVTVPLGNPQQDPRRSVPQSNWLQKLDPNEPVMLFTKPLVPDKLSAAGIIPPIRNGSSTVARGRIGRGGRIVFDRWKNPLSNTPIDYVETPSSFLVNT